MNNALATILIVEDHPIVREGLASLISNVPDLTISGEAEDIDAALRLTAELKPDVVLIDISLKSGNGIDLIKQLRGCDRSTKMLVHSMYDEAVYAERSLQAGAMGYLNKQSSSDCLIDAIRTVLAGETYLSPDMTKRIISSRVGGMPDPGKSPIDSLSDRELEVFTLIGQGRTTSAIANQLHLSVHTIDTYREKLKTKLRAANSAELIRYAVQWVLENG